MSYPLLPSICSVLRQHLSSIWNTIVRFQELERASTDKNKTSSNERRSNSPISRNQDPATRNWSLGVDSLCTCSIWTFDQSPSCRSFRRCYGRWISSTPPSRSSKASSSPTQPQSNGRDAYSATTKRFIPSFVLSHELQSSAFHEKSSAFHGKSSAFHLLPFRKQRPRATNRNRVLCSQRSRTVHRTNRSKIRL